MPLGLSELLERIRPAGAPGAPTEGERQRRRDDRASEIAGIAHVLASFEAESRTTVAAANAEGERLRRVGQARAAEARAGAPDRIAVGVVQAGERHQDLDRSDAARVRAEADREIACLQERAEADIPRLVDRAMQVIWSSTVPSDDERAAS
jgi:hypothetical protein